MDKHLLFEDPVDQIFCPDLQALADFHRYTGDHEPTGIFCYGCERLIEDDLETTTMTDEQFERWSK